MGTGNCVAATAEKTKYKRPAVTKVLFVLATALADARALASTHILRAAGMTTVTFDLGNILF